MPGHATASTALSRRHEQTVACTSPCVEGYRRGEKALEASRGLWIRRFT